MSFREGSALLPGHETVASCVKNPWAPGLLVLCACACGAVAGPASPAGPTPSPSPLSTAELRYRLIDTVGSPIYCRPMQGPFVPVDEAPPMVAALRAQDPAEFDAIVRREHLHPASLTQADDLRILDQASLLEAVKLTRQGSGYGFVFEVAGSPPDQVSGTIDAAGAIQVISRTPGPKLLCPV
jgi:hypothetical protein